MTAEKIAIDMQDVTFRYLKNGKRNILDHVSLTIEAGKITVLMGNSGCGKSTLAGVMTGIYPENGGYLDAGEITLFGNNLFELNAQKRAVFITEMFQNPDLQFCMDTLQNEMRFCLENMQVPAKQMDKRISETVHKLGVAELLTQPFSTMSGGEKQKAALACLCVMGSKCILLDEAFANIDERTTRDIIYMLSKLKEQGITIIAIDHKLSNWIDVADEIIILGEGAKVIARGITKENLSAHQKLLLEQGLLVADENVEKKQLSGGEEAAVTLQDVTIHKLYEKRLLSKPKGEGLLIEKSNVVFLHGCMSAVIGDSGSGKTTSFLSILKQHSYEGKIIIDNKDLRHISRRELYRKVGIVFQNPANQFITQNVEEEIVRSIRLEDAQITQKQCEDVVAALLKDFDLERYRRYSPYMLSQGQQRRLAVLSMIAGKKKILFLDEPTYGQDERQTSVIMRLLKKKVTEEGLTVVFITHDLGLANRWADAIYCLKDKRLSKYHETEWEKTHEA